MRPVKTVTIRKMIISQMVFYLCITFCLLAALLSSQSRVITRTAEPVADVLAGRVSTCVLRMRV